MKMYFKDISNSHECNSYNGTVKFGMFMDEYYIKIGNRNKNLDNFIIANTSDIFSMIKILDIDEIQCIIFFEGKTLEKGIWKN